MKKILVIALIILGITYLLFTREGNDDEFFTAYFNNMVEAAKSKDLDNFMKNFSLQYHDDYGFNYLILKNSVKNVLEKNQIIDGSFTDLSSSVSEDGDGNEVAVINLDVEAKGINKGIEYNLLGHEGTLENITIFLEKSSLGSWKIVRVEGVDSKNY